ncbi:DegT/DnrJ/EryC1/StrS family aminotransferase [Candidatus Methylopumilus universalis]|uniref:DegT/DnrJ/EryC1/StrS family aminotransferase n=1 Tax=Candidatus Methylopumilus universalis TaxID=2588536 RepID=UPI003BEEDF22
MKINKFDLRYSVSDIKTFVDYSKKILKKGFLAEGIYLKEFEKNFLLEQKNNFGNLVGSGTDALQIAFEAADLEGYEVLIPANTFVATYIAAFLARAKIKLIDVNPIDGILTLNGIKKNITKNTKAVCIVHIGGHISKEIFEIKKFCKNNDILLIEDAAHCVGSSFKNKYAGTFGDFGCFSFFPTKSLTMGEGGFITFQDKELVNKVYGIKNFGRTSHVEDEHNILGFNMKVTELQAALGLVDLKRFNQRLNRRRELFYTYLNELSNPNFQILHSDSYGESSCYKIIIKCEKDRIVNLYKEFEKNSIAMTGKVYSKQISEHLAFQGGEIFPNAKTFIDEHFCPPLYPELNKKQIQFITSIINKG